MAGLADPGRLTDATERALRQPADPSASPTVPVRAADGAAMAAPRPHSAGSGYVYINWRRANERSHR